MNDQTRNDDRSGNGGDDRSGNGSGRRSGGDGGSALEWTVAAVSALLVLAVIGYLVALGVRTPDTPASVTVTRDRVVRMSGGYVVTFDAHNDGATTAASVQVDGELKADTGTVEKRSVVLHFVPAGATRSGGLFFRHDPGLYRLDLSANGFDRP